MDSSTRRKLGTLGLTLTLAVFLPAGCDEDASPTVPAPVPEVPEPPQIRQDSDPAQGSEMDSILGSIVAGTVAAITATSILGIAKLVHAKYLQRLDIKQIQNILTAGRQRVLKATDTHHSGMDATIPKDVLRAAQYNLMIEQLRVVLHHRSSKLSHGQEQELLDALDWYHVNSLYATKDEKGSPRFAKLPPGNWPTGEMQERHATEKFDRLASIRWLGLDAYTSSDS